jgi:putative nucleotidyltransferase with HDIG domain
MNREEAWELLCEFTRSQSLRRHALAVEAAMAAYAEHFGEDEERWRVCGLLHDFDYERWPEEHPVRGAEILAERGVDEELRTAILGHSDATGVPRESLMARTLYAVDELSGFMVAVALVRPERDVGNIQPKSVKKKLKDKKFAAQVNREEVRRGAEELGVDFDEHLRFMARALSRVAPQLGLNP